MATSVKEALRQWEEENKGVTIGRATEVVLSCRLPPIQKLDASLSLLTSVTVLSLSSNTIEKITGLQRLKNLRILSLARNNLRDLSGVEVVADSLEQLWVSYNFIEKIKVVTTLTKLRVFYIAHNLIKDWAEVQRLSDLPQLQEVLFLGNPIAEGLDEEKYQAEVAKRLLQVKTIDGETVLRE